MANLVSQNYTRLNQSKYKWLILTPVIFVIVWLLLSLILLNQSTGLIFNQSVSYNEIRPANYQQEFTRNQAGENLDLWFYDNPNSNEVILYLHGNAGRLPHFFESIGQNHDVLAPTYPGFGLSEGSPTTQNVYETSQLAFQYLVDNGYSPENIIIFGHSLGGSAAVYLASKQPESQKLILVNAFDSMQSLCFNSYSIFCVFAGRLFNTAEYARKVTIPVRQFHYDNDDTVPFKNGEKLYTYFNSTDDKKFTTLTESTHSYFDLKTVLED